MNKKILFLLLFCLTGSVWGLPAVWLPESAEPGSPFILALKGEGTLAGVQVRLLDANGLFIAGAPVFSLQEDKNVSICLFGVPDYVQPGEYELELEGKDGANYFWLRKPVTVPGRRFDTEDIVFASDMTELKNSDKEKKAEEAAALVCLLRSFDPEAQYFTGEFVYPLKETRRTSGFGDRRNYIYSDGYKAASTHLGIDYGAPSGTPVFASGGGKVVFAGRRITSGNTVVLEHFPSVFSLYFHLERIDTELGNMVAAGDPIGLVGATGLVTGPHLHWEFQVSGSAVDPEWFTRNNLLDIIENLGIIGGRVF